ncbi:ATP-grasp fold amidoligase family protein [Alkalibacterium sp. 20]|uniref:ATP-grasp fold amidoligase family protein n=1 Tax=Alkalibacterium sp. 20 TaxID=1798803 RepID=UPI001C42EAC3|nr:ATP-grasp fold amidoligase family protein [Alkalibacterium sp. 20]
MSSLVKTPRRLIRRLGNKYLLNWLPDYIYIRLVYWGETGQKLNIKNPKSYNEKIQWIKLYDRKTLYNVIADKYAVRAYVREKIGEKYLIPLIAVYDNVDEIEWDSLPKKFVLKCTHGSGSNIICSGKKDLDIIAAKRKLNKWMKKNWFWFGREWAYKDIKPRIICEDYMTDESGVELKDYKIFCFNGEPKLIEVDFDRHSNHQRNLYTLDWEYIDATIKYPNDSTKIINKPTQLTELLELARKLSENIPHARIDFYSIDDNIYFGEITLYHGSGFERFEPQSLGLELGDCIKLPKIINEKR